MTYLDILKAQIDEIFKVEGIPDVARLNLIEGLVHTTKGLLSTPPPRDNEVSFDGFPGLEPEDPQPRRTRKSYTAEEKEKLRARIMNAARFLGDTKPVFTIKDIMRVTENAYERSLVRRETDHLIYAGQLEDAGVGVVGANRARLYRLPQHTPGDHQ